MTFGDSDPQVIIELVFRSHTDICLMDFEWEELLRIEENPDENEEYLKPIATIRYPLFGIGLKFLRHHGIGSTYYSPMPTKTYNEQPDIQRYLVILKLLEHANEMKEAGAEILPEWRYINALNVIFGSDEDARDIIHESQGDIELEPIAPYMLKRIACLAEFAFHMAFVLNIDECYQQHFSFEAIQRIRNTSSSINVAGGSLLSGVFLGLVRIMSEEAENSFADADLKVLCLHSFSEWIICLPSCSASDAALVRTDGLYIHHGVPVFKGDRYRFVVDGPETTGGTSSRCSDWREFGSNQSFPIGEVNLQSFRPNRSVRKGPGSPIQVGTFRGGLKVNCAFQIEYLTMKEGDQFSIFRKNIGRGFHYLRNLRWSVTKFLDVNVCPHDGRLSETATYHLPERAVIRSCPYNHFGFDCGRGSEPENLDLPSSGVVFLRSLGSYTHRSHFLNFTMSRIQADSPHQWHSLLRRDDCCLQCAIDASMKFFNEASQKEEVEPLLLVIM